MKSKSVLKKEVNKVYFNRLNKSDLTPEMLARFNELRANQRSPEQIEGLIRQTKNLTGANKNKKVNNPVIKAFMQTF